MRDLLLIACFIAVAAFVYWIAKKADRFLAENIKSDDCDSNTADNLLRIAFSNPLTADGLCRDLELLSKEFFNAEFILYGGSSYEILEGLANDEIDICFVDENIGMGVSRGDEIETADVMLCVNNVTADKLGLTINPFITDNVCQKAVWKSKNHSELLKYFTNNIDRTGRDV